MKVKSESEVAQSCPTPSDLSRMCKYLGDLKLKIKAYMLNKMTIP